MMARRERCHRTLVPATLAVRLRVKFEPSLPSSRSADPGTGMKGSGDGCGAREPTMGE